LTPTEHDRIAWFTRVNPAYDLRRIPSTGALPTTEIAIQESAHNTPPEVTLRVGTVERHVT
jgi:hypothetical protein